MLVSIIIFIIVGLVLFIVVDIVFTYLKKRQIENLNDFGIRQLKKGDLLFSREMGFNRMIPGYWSHSRIYFSGKVIEATTMGVKITPLRKFLRNRKVAVGRVEINQKNMRKIIDWAVARNNKNYNWLFFLNNHDDKFYCSEFVCNAFRQGGVDLKPSFIYVIRYALAIVPQDVYGHKHVKILGMLKR